jgi:hypothetical protein
MSVFVPDLGLLTQAKRSENRNRKVSRMGKFQKGQSGNPNGRPRGARDKATQMIEALFGGDAEAIARKAVDMAKGGDTALIRLCLDRLLPPRRDRYVAFALPEMKSAADAVKASAAIAAGLAAGELTPSEAAALSGFVANYVKALEARDFEDRLCKAEAEVAELRE